MNYSDRNRYLWLSQPLLPLLPSISCVLAVSLNNSALYWLTVIFWFGLVSLLDEILPKDANNPPEDSFEWLERDQYYEKVLMASVPAYILNFVFVSWFVSKNDIGLLNYIGLAVSLGIVSGLALAVGHELGHKTAHGRRRIGKVFLAIAGCGQFLIAHLNRHHVDVCTPVDSASSQMGESLYHFGFVRQQPGFFRESWALEKRRLERKGKGAWHIENETLQQYLMTGSLYGGLTIAFGLIVLPLLLLQMYVCWWYLSLIEYCQHYGLKRELNENGSYKAPTLRHSWNTNMLVSNNLLLNFVRHSPHHSKSTRWYQALRNVDEAPVLPYCYPIMFMAAMAPPVFYKLMDPRVASWTGGDLTKANIYKPAENKLRTTYDNQLTLD